MVGRIAWRTWWIGGVDKCLLSCSSMTYHVLLAISVGRVGGRALLDASALPGLHPSGLVADDPVGCGAGAETGAAATAVAGSWR